MNLELIRCADIRPDPRSTGYRQTEVATLADDIRAHGMLRPVLVRPTESGYVLVHGERRWRAAQLLGLSAIPACLVQEITREAALAA